MPDPLPHNSEAEKALLGGLMLDPDRIDRIAEIVEPEDMYAEAHAELYRLILRRHDRNDPVDMVAVVMEAEQERLSDKVGGLAYVSGLPDSAPATENLAYYANLIRHDSRCREVLSRCRKAEEHARSRELNEARDALLEQSDHTAEGVTHHRDTLHRLVTLDLPRRMEAEQTGESVGLPMPWPTLQAIFQPEPTDLVLIGARPAMGKSALMEMIADDHAQRGIGVVDFNLEMSKGQSTMRRLAARSGVPFWRLKTGKMTREHLTEVSAAASSMSHEPFWLDDTPAQTVEAIRRKMRRMKRQHSEIGAFVVDYLTLCAPPGHLAKSNRAEQVGYMAQAFKNLAKELDVVGYVVCQLNRQIEGRKDKHPIMADWRESGAIEQAADTMLGLMRPGYYDEADHSGLVDIDLLKNRSGKTGRIHLYWEPEGAWFADRDADNPPPWRTT